MKFEDVLKGLREGKIYRLPSWHEYIALKMEKGKIGTYMYLGDKSFCHEGYLTFDDIDCDDWIEIKK